MGKNKLDKFAENETFAHLFQPDFDGIHTGNFNLSGKWETFFKNSNPLILELACGKGEYSVGLAALQPHFNYIGMDIKGARLWSGAKRVKELGLGNVAFIRQKIDFIEKFFSTKDRVEQLWVVFADPQPRKSKSSKRLTSPMFLSRYRKFMDSSGIIHLKTDSPLLYQYTLDVIAEQKLTLIDRSTDIYSELTFRKDLQIKTHYERMWLAEGRKIHYVSFYLGNEPG
jgi:tRNA (guanine-N7-)-methyltransferase